MRYCFGVSSTPTPAPTLPSAVALSLDGIIAFALRGQLSKSLIAEVWSRGVDATQVVMLAVNAHLASGAASGAGAHTPSGAIPIHQKPAAGKRPKKPGGKKGHTGTRREAPPPDRTVVHPDQLNCPECGTALPPASRRRERTVQDVTPAAKTECVLHTIPRQLCPLCKKEVEPIVADALPNAMLGHRLVSLSAWFHYGLGITLSNVSAILGGHLDLTVGHGGLVDMWRRTGAILEGWYDQIGKQARNSAVLHVDETGWRVKGSTHWLWCFCNKQCCWYLIDKSRGSPALLKFFTEAFRGVLITDFWAAYESVWMEGDGEHQYCLGHPLREMMEIDERKPRGGGGVGGHFPEWNSFSTMFQRLLRDGIRLRKRPDYTKQKYQSRITRLNARLVKLAEAAYTDPDAIRLAKRFARHQDSIFTFLDVEGVEPTNNHAERMIRPAVIIRKNSQGNRSDQGAKTQAVLMSVFQTLKLRGHDPLAALTLALQTYTATGSLPPLPPPAAAHG